MTDSTYIRSYNGKSTRLDNLCLGADNNSYRLYVNGASLHTNTINFDPNTVAIDFRHDNNTYHSTLSYQTAGNEALVFANKSAATSFIFINGEDSITNHSSSRWKSLTPGLQIKQNCVSIGELIADGTNPSYKLQVNGTGDNLLKVGNTLLAHNKTLAFGTSSNEVTTTSYGSINPGVNKKYNLGTDSARWLTTYSDTANTGKVFIAKAVTLQYNSTTKSLDFIFA